MGKGLPPVEAAEETVEVGLDLAAPAEETMTEMSPERTGTGMIKIGTETRIRTGTMTVGETGTGTMTMIGDADAAEAERGEGAAEPGAGVVAETTERREMSRTVIATATATSL